MKPSHFFATATVAMVSTISVQAQATIPADFSAIIGTTAGTVSDGYGSPGSVPVYGRASFPVLIDSANVPVVAAGSYGDGVSSTAARAVAAAHTGFLNTSGTNTTSQLFINSVLWASRKSTPASITVASNSSTIRSFFSARGYITKAVDTSMVSASTDLSGCDVFVGSFHDGYTAAAITKIKNFTAAGGGIVVVSTPWALSTQGLTDSRSVLDPFGLTFSGSGPNASTFTVATTNYPTYHSAKIGLDQIVTDAQGGTAMTLAAKVVACGAVDKVLAVYPSQTDLVAGLETLQGIHGWIAPTPAAPIVVANSPVQAMLTRYQSGKLDNLAPGAQFVHPVASDLPGLPTPGATRVTRSVTINGNTAASSYLYMQHASRPTRIETSLYAGPGEVVTITLPADKVGAGLQVHIGASQDTLFSRPTWDSYPKLWRRQDLTAASNQVGHAIGGLITILVPPGSTLGNFDITIANALPAPCFTLGADTNATWNATLKNNPAPWGFVRTPKLTIYVRKSQLQAISDIEAIANHWNTVMNTADDYYGYTPYRKRGEVIVTNRQTSAGSAYAGYPIEDGWGVDSETELTNTLVNGNWGSYHELGHTFQADFNQAFRIPTHAEVDVNLFPGMMFTLIHGRTAWDNNSHSTFDAGSRTTDRAAFLAQAASARTWADACGRTSGYDFYFNLSEAFGWSAYRTALTRLMGWLQGQPDAAISALVSSDPNYVRNRYYLIMCDATGRNLDLYFQRYGLGVTGLGYEITQSVKDTVAAKGYPVWTDNQPLTSLANPGTLSVSEGAGTGTVIGNLPATDPEPGTIFTYEISAGNGNGNFSINKRTGALTVNNLDYEKATSHNLTVTCYDNGLPRYSLSQSFTVNVGNVVEAPAQPSFAVLTASSAQSVGTVLGSAIQPDVTRTVTASVVSGAPAGAFTVNSAGQLILANPAALTSAALLNVVVHGTDSAGIEFNSSVRVLVNTTPGLYEQRWAGGTNFTNNTWTGTTNYAGNLSSGTTGQNVADSYSRRVLGWLVPQVSGDYTFWISSDDASRFYLGTDATEASKVQRGSVSGYTGYQSFDSQSSQKSVVITLTAGKAYWFEAQQSEGGGGDHVSVAWQGPDVTTRSIVAGSYLIPNQAGVLASWQLPRPPAFTANPIAKADAPADLVYSGSIAANASDPDAGDVLTFAKVSGPSWLTVSSTGVLGGTPTNSNAGPNSFIVKVTDSTNASVNATLNINVIASDPAADPDGDGFTTGLELTLGTNPYSAASQPAAIYANLRAWWKLDETSGTVADDSTGRVQDGTVTGASWTTGITGNSLSFNGVNNGVLMGTTPAVTGTADFAVSAWVKVAAGSSGGVIIQQREPGASGYLGEYMLNVNTNGTLSFMVYGSGGYQFNLTSTATVNDGQWHLVSGVRGGTTGTIYLDGISAASGTGTIQTLNALAVSVGYDNRDLNKWFNGQIDDVRVYTRALSASELNSQHDGLVPNHAPTFTTNPVTKSAATEGTAYTGQTLAGSATDVDFGDTQTYSKVSGPSWLTVAADGTLTGTPGAGTAGVNVFTVRVTDGSGSSSDATLDITVNGLPLPWLTTKIGTANLNGSSTHNAGAFTVTGSGLLTSTADTGYFMYQALTGDGEIIARINTLQNTGTSSRVGVMIRNTLAANSGHVFMGMSGTNGYNWVRRTTTGGTTSSSTSSTGTVPNTWVRIVRTGNSFVSYKSTNGTSWTSVGTVSATFSASCYIGLWVGSGSNTTTNASVLNSLTVTP